MLSLMQASDRFAKLLGNYEFIDDFDGEFVAEDWAAVGDATAAPVAGDAANGTLVITAAAATPADNNEEYIHRPNENLLFASTREIIALFRLQYAEAATNAANIIVGMMDAVGANALQDNGAGPKASYSGMVLYKVDGGTNWIFETSIGSSQTTTTSEKTAGGSGFVTIGLIARGLSSTKVECIPLLDDSGGFNMKQLRDANGNLIKHTLDPSSATEMELMAGLKMGSSTAETLTLDLAACGQSR